MIRQVCGHIWEARQMSSVILELNLDKHEEIFALPGKYKLSPDNSDGLTAAPIVARVSVSSPSMDEMPSGVELWQTRGTDERSMAERFRILPRVDCFHNTFTVVTLLHRQFSHLVVGMTGNVRKSAPSAPCKHNVIVCVEPALSDGHGGEPALHPLTNRELPFNRDDAYSPQKQQRTPAPSYPQPHNYVSPIAAGRSQPPHRADPDESIFYYSSGKDFSAPGSRAQQLEPSFPPQAAEAAKASMFFHRSPQQQSTPAASGTRSGSSTRNSYAALIGATPPQYVQSQPSTAVMPPAQAPSQHQQQGPSPAAVQPPPLKHQEDIQALHFRRLDTSSRAGHHPHEGGGGGSAFGPVAVGGGQFVSPAVPTELQFRLPGEPTVMAMTPAVKLQNGSAAPSPHRSSDTSSSSKPLVLREEQTQTSRSTSPPAAVIPAPELQSLMQQHKYHQQQQQKGCDPNWAFQNYNSGVNMMMTTGGGINSSRPGTPPPPPPPMPIPPIRESSPMHAATPFTQTLSVREMLALMVGRIEEFFEGAEDLAALYGTKQQRLWLATAAYWQSAVSPTRRSVVI